MQSGTSGGDTLLRTIPGSPTEIVDGLPTAVTIRTSAGGLVTVALGDGGVRVYDGSAGTFVGAIEDDVTFARRAAATDRWVAVSAAGASIRVYERDPQRLRARFEPRGARLQGLALAPDGSSMYSALPKGRLQPWDLTRLDLSPDALLEEVRARFGVYLDGTTLVLADLPSTDPRP